VPLCLANSYPSTISHFWQYLCRGKIFSKILGNQRSEIGRLHCNDSGYIIISDLAESMEQTCETCYGSALRERL
jgi:hypothetical protein